MASAQTEKKLELEVRYGIGSNYFIETEGRELHSKMDSHHRLMLSAELHKGSPILFLIFVIFNIYSETVY